MAARNLKETQLLPNGEEVVYYDKEHKYFVREKEVPSITTIIREKYGDIYGAVNPNILQRSADYGTTIHKELSNLIELRKKDPNTKIESNKQEVQNYFNLVEDIYKIEPDITEKIVVLYNDSKEPIAAGRFDLLCKVNGKLTLADFKTTSTIHRQTVTAQLNLYAKAAYQSGYIKDPKINLGVIHLSGITAKYVPIAQLNDVFCSQFIK